MADFTTFSDGTVTSGLAEQKGWKLEFLHIATGAEVHFKAFITQYSEAFTSEWESVDAYGRMDPIMTFKKTGRTVSLGWDVVAESAAEAVENMQRVNMLIKMLYPVYKGNYLSAGPLFKFKFANLVTDNGEALTCTLNGLSYQPDTEDSGFIDPASGELYPKKINLSTELTILHHFHVGWDEDGNWNHPTDAEGINWPFSVNEQSVIGAAPSTTTTSGVSDDLANTLETSNSVQAGTSPGSSQEEPS